MTYIPDPPLHLWFYFIGYENALDCMRTNFFGWVEGVLMIIGTESMCLKHFLTTFYFDSLVFLPRCPLPQSIPELWLRHREMTPK